jgi:hypothetical protein
MSNPQFKVYKYIVLLNIDYQLGYIRIPPYISINVPLPSAPKLMSGIALFGSTCPRLMLINGKWFNL